MPVIYRIDKANQLIHTRCTGDVTIEEVLDHFRVLERDPDLPARADVLLDLSEQTSIPEKENLREVTNAIARIRAKVQFGAFAIVAPANALFGMLRMFEVFAEEYVSESSVFHTLGEAEAWLAVRRPTTSAAH